MDRQQQPAAALRTRGEAPPRGIGGCANVGVVARGEEGAPHWLLGSVSDDPYDIRTRVVVDRGGPLAYVATELQPARDVGMAARGYVVTEGERGRGVNEAGFALTWAFVDERDSDPDAAGMSSWEFTRRVLAECRSVDDALSVVEGSSRNFSGAWLFADARGDFTQVEIGRRAHCVVQRQEAEAGAFAVNVNCWQDASMCKLQKHAGSLEEPDAPNRARRDAAVARLAALGEPASISDVARVLTDHQGIERVGAGGDWVFQGHGFSICNHGTFGEAWDGQAPAFGTVSAEISDPVTRTLWYCYGWPCGETAAAPDQPLQDRSWGRFLPFSVDALPEGAMTTVGGELTPLGVRHLELEGVLEASALRIDGTTVA